VYLVDTDVISEARKGERANPGVKAFFVKVTHDDVAVYLSVITIGELRQGVEKSGIATTMLRPSSWNVGCSV